MVQYNKVEINGNYLNIDFQFENQAYYADTYFNGVRIDTQDTYGTSEGIDGVTDTDFTAYTDKFYIPTHTKDLIIVTPSVATETISPDTPCGKDVVNATAVYDEKVLLEKGLGYLKTLGDTCNISREFIDFILKKQALDMAIKTCNFDMAIKYWRMLTMVKGSTLKGCGCNGK